MWLSGFAYFKSVYLFRSKRSTLTAWAQIQLDWANNTDKKLVTGVLMWDLSAAFDTLDHDKLLSKFEIYGFSPLTTKWMRSYLTGRTQRIKMVISSQLR